MSKQGKEESRQPGTVQEKQNTDQEKPYATHGDYIGII